MSAAGRSALVLAGLASVLSASMAGAHHGRDFLLCQTPNLPHPGEVYLVPRQDYLDTSEGHEVEFEPAILFGTLDWLSLEIHSHVAKDGGEPFTYESTAAAVQLRLTPETPAFMMGLSAEYEFPSESELPDRTEARVMLSSLMGRSLLAFNLIAENEMGDGADPAYGYSAGWRRQFSRRVSWGLEALGSFEGEGQEFLSGLYLEVTPAFTVNLGAGAGLDGNDLDFAIRTVLVFRLGPAHEEGE